MGLNIIPSATSCKCAYSRLPMSHIYNMRKAQMLWESEPGPEDSSNPTESCGQKYIFKQCKEQRFY